VSYVYLFMGGAGTGKSSCALSGEGTTGYHEFDVGSYDRAVSGSQIDLDRIVLNRHWAPITSLKALGRISAQGVGVQERHLEGWAEMYNRFIDAYMANLEAPEIKQVVLDTETGEWLAIRNAFQQQIQNSQNKEEAGRMIALAYTEPNSRYSQIVTAAKMFGKDLILIGHTKEEYKNDKPTGNMIHDGHKEAPNLADLTLEFTIENKQPVATVRKAGAGGLELVGMKLVAPTLSDLRGLLDGAALIRRSGLSLPAPLTMASVKTLAGSLA
jgi:hypothetical protein